MTPASRGEPPPVGHYCLFAVHSRVKFNNNALVKRRAYMYMYIKSDTCTRTCTCTCIGQDCTQAESPLAM